MKSQLQNDASLQKREAFVFDVLRGSESRRDGYEMLTYQFTYTLCVLLTKHCWRQQKSL